MPRSLSPVVLPGDPSSALQASTRQYIDTGLAAKANASLIGATNGIAQLGAGGQVPTSQIPDLSSTYATLATNQTISGAKSFSSPPTVPATTATGHAVNRGEIDDRGLMPYSFRLSRWGLLAATYHPMINNSSGTYSTNYLALTRCFIPAGVAIANIALIASAAGSGTGGTGVNGVAVYEISGTTATLAASSANDATMWATTGWIKKTLSSTVAAQGSDRDVLLGHGVSIATAPAVMLLNMRSAAPFNTRVTDAASVGMTYYVATPTGWPSTFSMTTNYDYFFPFLGVY